MACPFCATGQLGLTRNLSTAEIIEQVRHAARASRDGDLPGGPCRLSNIVFMGMGEPLANYKAVIGAVHRMVEPAPKGFGISAAKAMFFSFVACSRNWRAFLAYALGLMLVVMVPSLLIGVLALVSPLIGQLFSIALPAVFIPVVFASFYANALDVFGTITPDDAA